MSEISGIVRIVAIEEIFDERHELTADHDW
jgi:hypothetical protein